MLSAVYWICLIQNQKNDIFKTFLSIGWIPKQAYQAQANYSIHILSRGFLFGLYYVHAKGEQVSECRYAADQRLVVVARENKHSNA